MMKEEEIRKFLANLDSDGSESLYGADSDVIQTERNREPIIKKVRFQPFDESPAVGIIKTSMNHLEDVAVNIKAVLGSSEIKVEGFLNMDEGSLLQLDTPIGDNVTLFINEQRFAKGEVIVINDGFAIRIAEINRLPNLEKLGEV